MGTNKQTADRWTSLSLWAIGFAEGHRYRAWVVYALCGALAATVPIVVQYRRGRGRQTARRMTRRIKSWGLLERTCRVRTEETNRVEEPPMAHYECDRCGACCKFPIIEIDELDLVREPKLIQVSTPFRVPAGTVYRDEDGNEVEEIVPGFGAGAMLACGPEQPCRLLGPDNRCTIYPSRPNCCVAFQAGSRLCQEAREAHGLPPLDPVSS